MKNATAYQKKLKKLLSGSLKSRPTVEVGDQVRFLLEAVLQEDASRKDAQRALAAFDAEFVDVNELRVAPLKDIMDCMDGLPEARTKAETLVRVLNSIIEQANALTLGFLDKLTKRDLRKRLVEMGLTHYSAALMTMVFGGHAVPVDRSLAYWLELSDCTHPGSDIEDVQGFLERVIPQKDDLAAHEFFREQVEKSHREISALHAKRLAEAPPPPPPAPEDSVDAIAKLPPQAAPAAAPAAGSPAGQVAKPKPARGKQAASPAPAVRPSRSGGKKG